MNRHCGRSYCSRERTVALAMLRGSAGLGHPTVLRGMDYKAGKKEI